MTDTSGLPLECDASIVFHNLITGAQHAYSGLGGFAVQTHHGKWWVITRIIGNSASVSGGQVNTASGFASSVSGAAGIVVHVPWRPIF